MTVVHHRTMVGGGMHTTGIKPADLSLLPQCPSAWATFWAWYSTVVLYCEMIGFFGPWWAFGCYAALALAGMAIDFQHELLRPEGTTMRNRKRSARAYWLVLAAVYGVSLSVFSTAPFLWAAVFVPAMIGFLAVHALYYGQAGRRKGGRFATATPGVGLLAVTGGAAALLLRGSPAAYWAGPVLAVVGFVVMFFFLDRFGKFAPQTPEGSS